MVKSKHHQTADTSITIDAHQSLVWGYVSDMSKWTDWFENLHESVVEGADGAAGKGVIDGAAGKGVIDGAAGEGVIGGAAGEGGDDGGLEPAESEVGPQVAAIGQVVHLRSDLFDFRGEIESVVDGEELVLRMVDGRFGPLDFYRLTIRLSSLDPESAGETGDNPRTQVSITQEWHGTVPVFGFMFTPLVRKQIRQNGRTSLAGLRAAVGGLHHKKRKAAPWWSPSEPMSRSEVVLLATICSYAVTMGYMTALTSIAQHQVIETFHSNDAGLGRMLFFIGVGAAPGLAILPFGDRIGRKRILLPALAVTGIATCLSAFAPNLIVFTILQAIVRTPMFVALGLAWIYVIEEMPAGSRAYSLSVFTMCGGLGGGIGLILLPFVMRGSSSGWRLLYLLGGATLFLVPVFARHLPETRRFERAWHNAPIKTLFRKPHVKWTVLVAFLALFSAFYGSPAGRYQGRYIQNGLGYSPGLYVIFTIVTTLPGGAGMILGGRLADTIGRRKVGITAATVGATSQAAMYFLVGAPLWISSAIGSFIGAMWVPALGSYTTELFPTSIRSTASSVSNAVGMGSGALGALVAGQLIVSMGAYGPAMLVLLPCALIAALLMYLFFPETARRELEDISPDIGPPAGIPGSGIGSI